LSLDRPEVAWRMDTMEADFAKLNIYPDTQKNALIPQDAAFYVVRKKDGMPAYHLASLIDDLLFGTDMIVRGNDLYGATLAQLDLARHLGESTFEKTVFHHHPLIKGPNQEKLSKSDGATSIRSLRKEGKTLKDIKEMIGFSDEL